jgi:hypothetical protein
MWRTRDPAHNETRKQPNRLRILSYLNLERLETAEGLTGLDKEPSSRSPTSVCDQGFGDDMNSALRNRL